MELAVYPDRAFFSANIEDIKVLETLNLHRFKNKVFIFLFVRMILDKGYIWNRYVQERVKLFIEKS